MGPQATADDLYLAPSLELRRRANISRSSSAANVMLDLALDFIPEQYLCRIPDRFSSPISKVGRGGGAGSHRALCGSAEL